MTGQNFFRSGTPSARLIIAFLKQGEAELTTGRVMPTQGITEQTYLAKEKKAQG